MDKDMEVVSEVVGKQELQDKTANEEAATTPLIGSVEKTAHGVPAQAVALDGTPIAIETGEMTAVVPAIAVEPQMDVKNDLATEQATAARPAAEVPECTDGAEISINKCTESNAAQLSEMADTDVARAATATETTPAMDAQPDSIEKTPAIEILSDILLTNVQEKLIDTISPAATIPEPSDQCNLLNETTNAMDDAAKPAEISEKSNNSAAEANVLETQEQFAFSTNVDGNKNVQEDEPMEESIETISAVVTSAAPAPVAQPATGIVVDAAPAPLAQPATGIVVDAAPALAAQPASGIVVDAAPATSAAVSGLGLLAEYDSASDDNESVVEVAATSNYRDQVVELDSATDSSSSDSDVEYLNEIRKKIDKRMQCDDDSDFDDDDDGSVGNKSRKHQPPKVKGELLLEDLPPIQDLHITVPEEECVELGRIHSIVEQLVLVNALPNAMLVNLDTVLFLDKGQRVLGEVFDVLGQVADPLYCVRFNSNQQIQERNIKVGDTVYVAPKTEHTQYVILSSLMSVRGSDASWENDIEPPPKCLDYSDDEEERQARQRMRNKKRAATGNGDDAVVIGDDSDEDDCVSVYSTADSTCSTQYGGRARRQNYRGNRRYANAMSHNTDTHTQHAQHSRQRNNNYNYNRNNQRNGSWHSNFHPNSNQMRQDVPYYAQPNTAMPQYAGAPMPHMYNPYGMQPPPMQYPMSAPAMAPYQPNMYGMNPYGMPPATAPAQHMPPSAQHAAGHFVEPPPPPGE